MTETNKEFLYGINPAFEAIKAQRRKIYQAYLFDQYRKNIRLVRLKEKLEKNSIPLNLCGKRELFDLANTTEHQGIILEASPYPYYAECDAFYQQKNVLLLDNVEDPQNLGAILRSAEVFGWKYVLLSSKGVPEIYPSVVKASVGATEHLNILRSHTANNFVKLFIEKGFIVTALDPSGKIPIKKLPSLASIKKLLVIGGEHKGVGQFILKQATYIFNITQRGNISSLNVSVAAGIALFLLGND